MLKTFNNSSLNIGADFEKRYAIIKKLNRRLSLSSLKYLARQGQAIPGTSDIENNLTQLLKLKTEDVPELPGWIKNGNYLSADIVNEMLEIMVNSVLQ
jgi:hypothetical protein